MTITLKLASGKSSGTGCRRIGCRPGPGKSTAKRETPRHRPSHQPGRRDKTRSGRAAGATATRLQTISTAAERAEPLPVRALVGRARPDSVPPAPARQGQRSGRIGDTSTGITATPISTPMPRSEDIQAARIIAGSDGTPRALLTGRKPPGQHRGHPGTTAPSLEQALLDITQPPPGQAASAAVAVGRRRRVSASVS